MVMNHLKLLCVEQVYKGFIANNIKSFIHLKEFDFKETQ